MRHVTPTVVVLGASGRLGRRLLPAFASAGFDAIAVARAAPGGPPGSSRSITADLTDPDERARLATTVATWTEGRDRVYIADVVLDRRGVEAMRRSVVAVTDTVLRLHDRLARRTASVGLVAASTTAVLAPDLYQTPYGLAKRGQVLAYARSGLGGGALLLPALNETGNAAHGGAGPWHVWSFECAADRLVPAALDSAFTIRVPDLTQQVRLGLPSRRTHGVGEVLRAHVRSLLTDRNSMHAHREAARGRLGVSPDRIRRRVDHHLAPAHLIRRFAERYHVHVVHEQGRRYPAT